MARGLACLLLALAVLAPAAWRRAAPNPAPARDCRPDGRGIPPWHWIGCAGDPGPPRALSGRERHLLGLPIDLNAAGPEDLAVVPGLTSRLAAEVVSDRERRGPFPSVDALLRVRGVGPARLSQARPFLEVHSGR